jgi:hypothetical protein
MNRIKNIPSGLLWGSLLFFSYIYLFFFVGFYFIWKSGIPDTATEFLLLIGGSIVYLGFSGFLFIVVFVFSIYLIFKDGNMKETVKNNWPVILTFLYPMIPNIPGPFDEGVLSVIMMIVRIIIFFKTGKELPEQKKVK